MIRLAPVLLMMASVASGAGADPACLPNCDGENLIGRDLRFANMPDASLRFASLVIANLARADLSGADLSFANLARADLADADLTRGAYDVATLRRWFAWIDRARRWEVECTLPVTMKLGAAMGATLPAVPIRVDSVLGFRSRRVYESRVAEYLPARGRHRPVVVVGWPTHGERQLVDGRHRMSAALVLELETIPAVFAMFADARRWGDGGCW